MSGYSARTEGHRSGGGAVRRRVVCAGTAAGVFLVFGMTPLATSPTAHADGFEDLFVEPAIAAISQVDPGPLGAVDPGVVDGLVGSALAGAASVDPLASLGELDTILLNAFHDYVYLPIYTLGESWINSPLGQLLDPLINQPFILLTGRGLIDNGFDGTAAHPDGGDAGWLFGDGGDGFGSGTGGAGGLIGNSGADGNGDTGGGAGVGSGGGGQLITEQYGSTTIQNAYVVQNNAWNNPNGQSIEVTPTGFSIVDEHGSAPTNGAPLAYPSIYLGCHYGNCSPDSPLPLALSQIQTATSSIDYTFPQNGIYDASYDIWLNPTSVITGVNQQEIMIWFGHQGSIQPIGHVVGDQTIDGKNFAVWEGGNGQNQVVSYVADTPISSWNNFNILAFIDNAETLETNMNDSWYLTSIQAGFEPWTGSQGAAVDSFSASINGRS